jgi:catechol 2,3-dioxygenase-like lactoylglutathione lyase family enzyme
VHVERIDFIALPVEDLARADAFYGDILGLARNPVSGDRWVEYETGNLTLALSLYGGGLALRVADVAESRGELEDTGIEFSMDTFDSGVCHGAPFVDPHDNRLLLHRRYASSEPFEIPVQEVERTDFIGVNVKDGAEASKFYGETLGMKRNPLSSDDWPEFQADNVGLVLSTPEQKGDERIAFEAIEATRGSRPEYAIALHVANVGRSLERLEGAGVEVIPRDEPYDTGVCHMAFFADPDGNALILHHRYAPYSDGTMP